MVWKRVKAVVSKKAAATQTPRPDVLVTGPAPVLPPDPASDGARERAKKRAMLLSGLVEAASRKSGKL